MNDMKRHQTGIVGLDEKLGGGLFPGTLTVVVGASGIGKTQLGLQYSHAACEAPQSSESNPSGIIFDMSARGDSQNHIQYAQRMFQHQLRQIDSQQAVDIQNFFDCSEFGEYLHLFDYSGRKVTRSSLDFFQWNDWKAELNSRLTAAIAFFYGNFTRGVRRVVIDGIEPVDCPEESIQLEMFEYIYHQILRKESTWVARDLFRQMFRQQSQLVEKHQYDHHQISCLLLQTSHEMMLDELITRRLEQGDLLSGANTIIYMGKVRDGNQFGRAMYIAKHRGSYCSDEMIPFKIDDKGLKVIE